MLEDRKTIKIALIGSGNIGGTLAHIIASEQIGEVILLDRTSFVAQGKALDIAQSLSANGKTVKISGTSQYEDIAGSDVVIITAGIARKPNMSRDDLLNVNAEVMQTVADGVKEYAPNAFVIVVTNPLDVMVYAFQKHSGLPTNKVVGMAGVLDSCRFKHFLSLELKIAENDIQTMVLGGHGDTMVPIIDCTSIGGIPLKQFIKNGLISQTKLDEIIQRTRDGGAEIVKLLQTGSAYYAPAAAAIEMMKSYLFNQSRLLPCCTYLNGEYGIDGLYVGVPVIINSTGVSKVLEVDLSTNERAQFEKSVNSVKDLVGVLKI
jgi:malate dehydrogenase